MTDGPYGPVVNGTQIVFYEYRPDKPAAITFVVLFAISTLSHLGFMIKLRAWFVVPFILGGFAEIFGYYGRAWSHDDPDRSGPFILQNVLLLAGPPFLAATIYMSLGRITIAMRAQHHSFINPRWMTKIFVLVDVGCIFSQFIGALMPVSGDEDSARKGNIILIVGLVTQLSALSLFILTSWHIYRRISRDMELLNRLADVKWKRHFRAIEAVTLIMIARSTVRSIEFLQGEGGYIVSHEIFIYIFDAPLMFLIMAIFLVIHPGQLVQSCVRTRQTSQGCKQHVRLQSWPA